MEEAKNAAAAEIIAFQWEDLKIQAEDAG